MAQILDFIPQVLTQLFGVGSVEAKAGAALAQKDLVVAASDNRIYPGVTVDYAVIGNAGQAVAQTSLVAGSNPGGYGRLTPQQGADGTLYFACCDSAASGIRVTRTTATGANSFSVTLDAVNGAYNPRVRVLGNGNLVVMGGTGTNVWYAVLDANLAIVKAWTQLASDLKATGEYEVCALTGGGFAVSYATTGDTQKLAINSNTGVVTLAPTAIGNWTGTAGAVYTNMVALSSGGVAIVVNSKYATTLGIYHGVWSAAGAQVLAFTNLSTTNNMSGEPEVDALTGFYAVGWLDGTNHFAKVFSVAGILQGGLYTSGSASQSGRGRRRMINDGTKFLYVFVSSTGTTIAVAFLPTTGVGFSTGITTVAYAGSIDAFYERNRVVVMQQPAGNAKINFAVISTLNFFVLTAKTDVGNLPTTNGNMMGAIGGGDFTFIACWDTPSADATHYYVHKYADSAVVGICRAAAAADTQASIQPNAGAYPTNPLRGVVTKQFDHTTGTTVPGNKGTLLNGGAYLKGM